jgi:hypothetical protein
VLLRRPYIRAEQQLGPTSGRDRFMGRGNATPSFPTARTIPGTIQLGESSGRAGRAGGLPIELRAEAGGGVLEAGES